MEQYLGFVLAYIKYGDSDAVVHTYTRESGYDTFFIKGIFSNKNRRKVMLQPLSELRFFTRKKTSGNMKHALDIEPVRILDDTDVKAMAIIFFIAEFLNQILRNEPPQQNIYTSIQTLAAEISAKNNSAHLFFLIDFLRHSGLAPLVAAGKYLDPENGIFKDSPSGSHLGKDVSAVWKYALDIKNLAGREVPPSLRAELLDSILLYFRWHYADFRAPKSLEIMRQLWHG